MSRSWPAGCRGRRCWSAWSEGSVLDDPLKSLVGDRTAAVLDKGLALRTVGDLLRHSPRRYAERGQLTDLASLEIDEHVTVMARVERATSRQFSRGGKRGSLLEVVVTDGRGGLKLTFFNQHWREKELRAGRVGLFSGKVGDFRGQRQLAHPDYVLLDDEAGAEDVAAFTDQLIPVYPATAQLPSWKVAQCVRLALDSMGDPPDPLPDAVRASKGLVPFGEALRLVHRPQSRADVARAHDRLRWDEAFVLQVALAQRRAANRTLPATARVAALDGVLAAFDARLPFALTAG